MKTVNPIEEEKKEEKGVNGTRSSLVRKAADPKLVVGLQVSLKQSRAGRQVSNSLQLGVEEYSWTKTQRACT